MFKTQFDATEKVWSGAKEHIQFEKDENFGEIILRKLAGNESEGVMQVNYHRKVFDFIYFELMTCELFRSTD